MLTLAIHPDVSGKPQNLLMHERQFARIARHPGVRLVTVEAVADDFTARFPFERPGRLVS